MGGTSKKKRKIHNTFQFFSELDIRAKGGVFILLLYWIFLAFQNMGCSDVAFGVIIGFTRFHCFLPKRKKFWIQWMAYSGVTTAPDDRMTPESRRCRSAVTVNSWEGQKHSVMLNLHLWEGEQRPKPVFLQTTLPWCRKLVEGVPHFVFIDWHSTMTLTRKVLNLLFHNNMVNGNVCSWTKPPSWPRRFCQSLDTKI